MRFASVLIIATIFVCHLSAIAENEVKPPEAAISNKLIEAKLYLPDAEHGYYRGARFDWSGVIHSLKFSGHEFFGEWQKSDDPYLHDRITGPVDSFLVDTDIEAGETFLRIGTGICQKTKKEDGWKHPFRVIDSGEWKVQSGANWIEMTQQIADKKSEQAYRYSKRLTLLPNRPELVIDHELNNTGKKKIATEVYNHNFFVMDNQPTGPDFVVQFPFQPKPDRSLKGFAKVSSNEIRYTKPLPQGDQIYALVNGFGSDEKDNQFTIENRKIKAGVRVVTDRPMSKLQYWSPRTTLCPEPFVKISIAPNQSERWSIRYQFYTLD